MAVKVDTSELDALTGAIQKSARQLARRAGVPAASVTDARMRSAQAKAFKAVVKQTRRPVQELARKGAPGKRLGKRTAYQVSNLKAKQGGFPKVKAGGRTKSQRAVWWSHFQHTGTRGRGGGSGIVGSRWMYRQQPKMSELFAEAHAREGEQVLMKYWESVVAKRRKEGKM